MATKLEVLKKQIETKSLPTVSIWIDNNHEIVKYYLDHVSLSYNRKLKNLFEVEEAFNFISTDFDIDNTVYVIYLMGKDIQKLQKQLPIGAMVIFITSDEVPGGVLIDRLSRNANLIYLEEYVATGKMVKEKRVPKGVECFPQETPGHFISRPLLEQALDYFEDDLDSVLNEIKKVEVLELQGSWDKPFEALLDCLPKKDKKLRSLKWFSGGDVDTCQVLYNLYMKKLKTLATAPIEEQRVWSKLVREAIWCEACIVSGKIGDYVSDYLRLVEVSLPGDFKVEYFPPVFFSEVESKPEWAIKIEDSEEDK